ncbi:MAG: sporulation protein YqfC [Defluviitaleaceae bacterium]|nr:sporulation protein YqfC [Defluviitaleaceae bacterium]
MDKFYIKRKISAALELPRDVTLGLPTVLMTGDEEVVIAGHKGLLEYSEGFVRLATGLGGLKIFGINLALREISAENVIVAGKIHQVTWEGN